VLVDLNRAKIPFMTGTVIVSGNYLREHPEVVEAVLKALVEAQAFVAAPANRGAVLQTMSRHMKLTNPTLLEDGYQDLQVGVEKKPYAQVDGLRNIQRMMATLNPKVKGIRVEDLIDNRFVRKLDESGYIDALYR
jgi:ABC-type nitrate/sulfonate/bicarbonate transport system substrate-binding protein